MIQLLYLGHTWQNFCALPLSLNLNWLFLWSFPVYFLTLFVLTHCGNDEGVVLPPFTPRGNYCCISKIRLTVFCNCCSVLQELFIIKSQSTLKPTPDISEMVFDSIILFLLISNTNAASQNWMCCHSSVLCEGDALNNYRLQCSFGTHCIASIYLLATKLHSNDLDWVTRKKGNV